MQTAVSMQRVTKDMTQVVRSMESALKSMNLEQELCVCEKQLGLIFSLPSWGMFLLILREYLQKFI